MIVGDCSAVAAVVVAIALVVGASAVVATVGIVARSLVGLA